MSAEPSTLLVPGEAGGAVTPPVPLEPLTPLQERFCKEYMVDLRGGPSWTRAGGTDNDASARSQASEALTKPNVRARIKELAASRDHLIGLSAERVLRAIDELAHADPAELFDADGNYIHIKDLPPEVRRYIASIETETTVEYEVRKVKVPGKKKGTTKTVKQKIAVHTVCTKLKLWDKPKNLSMQAQHLGLLVRRHAGPDGKGPIPIAAAVGVVTLNKEQVDAAYRNLGLQPLNLGGPDPDAPK